MLATAVSIAGVSDALSVITVHFSTHALIYIAVLAPQEPTFSWFLASMGSPQKVNPLTERTVEESQTLTKKMQSVFFFFFLF